ncbi:hypothetical protein GOP47_0029787 [Adiantum capillus-veneris]|nr:hypothetical protein GOP47_0029787 [Adiantum capillus-veneris]
MPSSPPRKRSKEEVRKPHKPIARALFHLNDSVNFGCKQAVVDPINVKKEAYLKIAVSPHALNEGRALHNEPFSIEPLVPL